MCTTSVSRLCKWIFVLWVLLSAQLATAKLFHVGVVPGDPFVVLDGGVRGIAVDLWTQIAAKHGWASEFVPLTANIEEELKKLESGKLDVVLGTIALSYHRQPYIDLTSPYFLSQVGFLVGTRQLGFWANLHSISRRLMNTTLLLGFILFFVIVHLIWLAERGRSKTMPSSYLDGVSHVFWHHLLDQIEDVPETIMGKLFSLFWFAGKAILLSSLMAVIVSAAALSYTASTETIMPNDALSTKRIVCVTGGPAEEVLKGLGINCSGVPSFEAGVKAVESGKADGYASMVGQIGYFVRQHNVENVRLSNIVLQNEVLTFAVPIGSPRRKIINDELAEMRRNGFAAQVCSAYLPPSLVKNCVF